MHKENSNQEFLQLIEGNKGIIFRICNAYCRNKNDREDLAQEIIYQLWKSNRSFNKNHKFSTWMYRVALNVAISFYRRQKDDKAFIPLTDNMAEFSDGNDYTDDMDEKIKLLQQFINELKELDKALMILYLDARTYSEIAEVLGITETNVATKISRIKDRLKEKFNQKLLTTNF